MKFKEHFKQITGSPQQGAYSKAFAFAYVSMVVLILMMIAAIELSHFLRQF